MDSFEQLLNVHLEQMNKTFKKSSDEILKRAYEHDQDKLNNPIIYNIYKEHFPPLKKIPFGTEEYFQYERNNFEQAHQLHAQNRHHFYSKRNNLKDVNLFDLLEAIIDISESAKQYGTLDTYKKSFKEKGIYNYDIEELINNTIDYLNK